MGVSPQLTLRGWDRGDILFKERKSGGLRLNAETARRVPHLRSQAITNYRLKATAVRSSRLASSALLELRRHAPT